MGGRPRRRTADRCPRTAHGGTRPRVSPVVRGPAPPSLLGGSIELPRNECLHDQARPVRPWSGAPGTVGTVAVVGAGKMGLPLAAQFASHGWSVTAVDIDPMVVGSINEGRSHVGDEPGLAELVAEAHANRRFGPAARGAAAGGGGGG